MQARVTELPKQTYYLYADPLVVWDGSGTSLLDYFSANLQICGPLGIAAYFNDTVTEISDSYYPNPVSLPQAYWNQTLTSATYWTASYGVNVGQTDYPFVACLW